MDCPCQNRFRRLVCHRLCAATVGQFVPAFHSLSPKFFAARLYCVKTINDSSSIVPPKVERTENIKAAAASSLDNLKMFVGEGALRLA